MSQPEVCAVMLVNGREAMVRRAVESFKAQTYEQKRLLIWDTGELNADYDNTDDGDGSIVHVPAQAYRDPKPTIGVLRNEAIAFWNEYPIILHWDSDDWSHPRRIEEQVALLQSSGREVVGYREMLFWKTAGINPDAGQVAQMWERGKTAKPDELIPWGEAWLYRNPQLTYCLGTSLCYWRDVWERKPFGDHPKKAGATGEDTEWIRELRSQGVDSFPPCPAGPSDAPWEPRMIASIHGANTQYYGADLMTHSPSWGRVPGWDDHCRKAMRL